MSWREIKYIYNFLFFPFPLLLNSLLLPAVMLPPRVSTSCVLSNPPLLYYIHLNVSQMTLLFYHLRQSTHNSSRDIFTLWGNTKWYTSISHTSHKSDWTPELSALVAPYSLSLRNRGLPRLIIQASSQIYGMYGIWTCTIWCYPTR